LRQVLDTYAAKAQPVDPAAWSRRSFGTRAVENLARLTAALQ
jgi:hypothetical protein